MEKELQKKAILDHLIKLGVGLSQSYGDELIILERKDFEKFAEDLTTMLEKKQKELDVIDRLFN